MFRVLTISLVVLLYLTAYVQHHNTSAVWNLATERVARSAIDSSLKDKKPYYKEYFVNDESPGTIHHVSSITQADDDKLICTWYGGSREGAKDVSIYVSTFSNADDAWTEPAVLVDRLTSAEELHRYIKKVGNALIFNDLQGHLWLFYSTVTFGGWSGTSLNYKVSSDSGRTWSDSKKLYLSPFLNLTSNVKNKGIPFKGGSFIIPSYHEFINKFSQIITVRPQQNSAEYRIRKMTAERSAIQPAVVYLSDKRMIAYFRNIDSRKPKKFILSALSDDMGRSWSEITDTSLPNPNSGFDMLGLDDGRILGVINNSFTDRSNLELIFSYDEGQTWRSVGVLENSPGKRYSYPSITRTVQGMYHITYTYDRRRIKHIVFNESWLRRTIDSGHSGPF